MNKPPHGEIRLRFRVDDVGPWVVVELWFGDTNRGEIARIAKRLVGETGESEAARMFSVCVAGIFRQNALDRGLKISATHFENDPDDCL